MSGAPLPSGPLARLASWCFTHRRRLVAFWLAGLVLAIALSSSFGGEHRADYSMPGSESAAVRELLRDRYPDHAGDPVQLVVRSVAESGLSSGPLVPRLEALREEFGELDQVAEVAPLVVAPDGRTGLLVATLDDRAEAVSTEALQAIIDLAARSTGDGLQVEAGGWSIQYAEQADAGRESFGLVAALIILLVVFGSALAAGIPILLALVGLGVGSGIAMLVAHLIDIPEWGMMLATMIGIGVGIDYALFIVTRYRTTLADGADPHRAVMIAMTTSGRAVLFAGGTVVVSLLGLGITGLEYMWGAAIAMVLGVFGVLAAATTLLPAVLGFAGRRIDRFRVPGVRRHAARSERWARWSRTVQRHPIAFGAVAVAALVALAVPVLDMRFGFPDAGTNPTSTTSRRAFDLTAEAFGAGANGPLLVAVDVSAEPGRLPAAEAGAVVAARIARDPGVAAVLPGSVSDDGTAVTLAVVPFTGPQDAATEALVRRLRTDVVPEAVASFDVPAVVHVGGLTALHVDEADYEASRLPWFIAAVLATSFLLLLSVFRAPLVALKAALLNLLGIAAAYGVVALAVQGGWFGGLIGIHEPTPVPVFVPILMFALLFGLSMDYEVFLLSRIREEHLAGAPNSEAVVEGLATTARVITAAAAIMVVVFGAFVLNDEVIAKVAGLGLAVAVLLDATVVRMVLVPATMELLGERNWWLPGWLDRRLPRFDVEAHVPAEAQVVEAFRP